MLKVNLTVNFIEAERNKHLCTQAFKWKLLVTLIGYCNGVISDTSKNSINIHLKPEE